VSLTANKKNYEAEETVEHNCVPFEVRVKGHKKMRIENTTWHNQVAILRWNNLGLSAL
jgi:hypothetical protein